MRVATYLRVSKGRPWRTGRATCGFTAEARDWSDIVEYSDQGINDTKDRRPGLDALMAAVRARTDDPGVTRANSEAG